MTKKGDLGMCQQPGWVLAENNFVEKE